jgi:hypothetical protein
MRLRRATRSDLDAVEALDGRVLPARDVIPAGICDLWRRANPDAFRVLVEDGRLLGYFSVLALAPEALAAFERGEIDERALGASDVLGPAAARRVTTVYFFTVARVPERPEIGRDLVAAAEAWWRSRRRYPCLERVVATVATEAGRRMLVRLGFVEVMPAAARRDGHALFECRLPFFP